MHAPAEILSIYRRFDDYPMENLTKAWYYHLADGLRQRTVGQMRKHREQYGLSGNCFDLALWLIDELRQDQFSAYGVGHGLHTEDAHVAVVVESKEGYRYLCDLGDQWLQPMLLDPASPSFCRKPMPGFFPAAYVKAQPAEDSCTMFYYRPNGKVSQQNYSLRPIGVDELMAAGEVSQHSMHNPLVEMRIPQQEEVAHWEFSSFQSWLSTSQGKFYDEPARSTAAWAERINVRTGMSTAVVLEALQFYENLAGRRG